MDNCLSRPTRRSRERSITSVYKKGDSTHQTLSSSEEDRSTHLQEINEDSGGTNVCHSDVDNEGYKTMLACHDKLVTALATDYLTIAGALLARGFVSEEIPAKMLLPSSTPIEKATILITAVRERIKIDPQQFPVLLNILSEHVSMECMVKLLQSAYQGEILYCACNELMSALYKLDNNYYD